jgi:hypothetical protein
MMSIGVAREMKIMPTKRHLRYYYLQLRAPLNDSNQDKTDSVKQRLSKFKTTKQAVKRGELGILTKGHYHLSFAEATPFQPICDPPSKAMLSLWIWPPRGHGRVASVGSAEN